MWYFRGVHIHLKRHLYHIEQFLGCFATYDWWCSIKDAISGRFCKVCNVVFIVKTSDTCIRRLCTVEHYSVNYLFLPSQPFLWEFSVYRQQKEVIRDTWYFFEFNLSLGLSNTKSGLMWPEISSPDLHLRFNLKKNLA